MRKHSVRKWLHAILDLLPVIILPIFAIYSHRHTIDSYEVTLPQNEVVNFNQLVNYDNSSPNIVSYYDLVYSTTSYDYATVFNFNYVNVIDGHIYYFRFNFLNSTSSDTTLRLYDNSSYVSVGSDVLYTSNYNGILNINLFYYDLDVSLQFKCNLYDLTLMFGSGNEPTAQEFSSFYPNYYEYNEGTKQLLKGVSTVTYDNSDIGSQMMYSLYKPINDYFNLNNVFNFGAIYDWFELNMFNGNAPLSIFIVWNIIVYEFIMDIIFLIYSVFMFVIDFACETLDRFTGWAKRGD